MTLELREAVWQDLESLAELHLQCYPSDTHFTSRMSPGLLKTFYGLFFDEPNRVVKATAKTGKTNRIHGFIVCGASIPAGIAVFRRNEFRGLLRTGLAHPFALLKRLSESIHYRFFDAPTFFKESPFLILSIVSDRKYPGVGRALVDRGKHLCRAAGYEAIGLYVRVNNLRAIRFYLKNGFEIAGYRSGQFYMEAPA